MKKVSFIITLLVLFGVVITPALARIDVGYVTIKPSGDLESGKSNVTADLQIDFVSEAGETFSSEENLLLSTQLENPVWNYKIVLDGVENERPASSKNQLQLTGWELSYNNVEERVLVSLKGNAPKTEKSKQIEVVSVSVTSPNGKVKDQVRNVTAFLTNPGELTGNIGTVKSKVKKLQTDIAGFKADGIDTTKAAQKLKEASDSLERASKESFANAKIYIQNAETYIKDAYGYLDMGNAQKTIGDAKEAIDRTDEWITYFKTNKSMETDPRLAPIITKREFAAEYAANAQELYEQGKYSEARTKADDANKKATEVFNDTQKLNDEISKTPVSTGPDLGALSGILMYVIIAIVIIVAAVGIFLLMKKRGGSGGRKGGSGKGGGGGSFGWKKRSSSKSKKSHQYDELF
jgi:tetratricopeptide (TPR) repeat protein